MRRVGWVMRGWTGRSWITYHDTLARTRRASIRLWCDPLGDDALPMYRHLRRAGKVKAVRTYVLTGSGHEASP